ncbi:PREDICTED: putative defensin-like protein 55 [Camelina sativa]|uniref:Defensin-like protein 55 n=1 Tax=Camelina sativa TaxID=90675 RepID=A0ABM1QD65_CAMSA|nr:PREDICTED: putative defensin-like protein 55 [Camelina sativa]
MSITKTFVIFFLVVILTNSLSNSGVLASSVIEASNYDSCTRPCTKMYGNYECRYDCTFMKYKDGQCVAGRCCCKHY